MWKDTKVNLKILLLELYYRLYYWNNFSPLAVTVMIIQAYPFLGIAWMVVVASVLDEYYVL